MVSAAITGMTGQIISGTTNVSGNTEQDLLNGVSFKQIMSKSLSDNSTKNKPSDGMFTDTVKANTSDRTGEAKTNLKADEKNEVRQADNEAKTDDNVVKSKDDAKDEIKEAVSDVKDAIKEELNVSDEEIVEMMANLGMTFVDLLDPQKVTDLMAALSGSDDAISFITDSDMLDSLNKVLEVVSDGLENAADKLDINVDEVKEMLPEMTFGDAKEEFEAINSIKTAKAEVKPETKEVLEDEVTVEGPEKLTDVIAKKLTVESDGKPDTDKESNAGSNTRKSSDFNQIADNLAQSISQSFEEITVSEGQMINEVDIVRQVIDNVRLTAGQNLQTIEVMLNPANLGSVHVTVTAKEGVVTAQLTAQNEQVKAALENQVIALKEQFNNQGIKVEAVEVTVESHSFESNQNLEGNSSNQAQQERKTSRRLDLSSLDEIDEDDLTTDELRARDSIVNGNSSVEFKA